MQMIKVCILSHTVLFRLFSRSIGLDPVVERRGVVQGTPLEGVAWGNDEADPKVHWSSSYDWRADARYAAMVPKIVAQHLDAFVSGAALGENFHYDLLSNGERSVSLARGPSVRLAMHGPYAACIVAQTTAFSRIQTTTNLSLRSARWLHASR